MGNFLAGAVGFEPTNAGSKSRCPAEMHMKNGGLLDLFFYEFKNRVREWSVCDAKKFNTQSIQLRNNITIKLLILKKRGIN